jgi:filamentous hemagglutinin
MKELNKFIDAGDAKGKAATIAAYDVMSGDVAVGVSGKPPENAPSVLVKRALKAGGIGNKGIKSTNTVGACAEFRAANQLVQGGSYVNNIRFTPALRHNNKGINVVATCDNCKDIFPNALSWITRFF